VLAAAGASGTHGEGRDGLFGGCLMMPVVYELTYSLHLVPLLVKVWGHGVGVEGGVLLHYLPLIPLLDLLL